MLSAGALNRTLSVSPRFRLSTAPGPAGATTTLTTLVPIKSFIRIATRLPPAAVSSVGAGLAGAPLRLKLGNSFRAPVTISRARNRMGKWPPCRWSPTPNNFPHGLGRQQFRAPPPGTASGSPYLQHRLRIWKSVLQRRQQQRHWPPPPPPPLKNAKHTCTTMKTLRAAVHNLAF